MQRFILLVLVLVGGWYGYQHFANSGPGFGTSKSRVIGDYEDIDSYLVAKGMSHTKGHTQSLNDIFGARFGGRDDLKVDAYKSGQSRVTVVQSRTGKLLAVGCTFQSGSINFNLPADSVGRFTAHYWKDVLDAEPFFAEKDEDGIRMAQQRRDKALCTWIKNAEYGDAKTSDLVTLVVTKTMLRNEAATGMFSND